MQTGYHFDGARYRNRKIIKYKKLNLGGEGKLNLESDDLRIPKLRVYVCVCMRMYAYVRGVSQGYWRKRNCELLVFFRRKLSNGTREGM